MTNYSEIVANAMRVTNNIWLKLKLAEFDIAPWHIVNVHWERVVTDEDPEEYPDGFLPKFFLCQAEVWNELTLRTIVVEIQIWNPDDWQVINITTRAIMEDLMGIKFVPLKGEVPPLP